MWNYLPVKGRIWYRIKRENPKEKHIPGGWFYMLKKKNTVQEILKRALGTFRDIFTFLVS
jgi:hypothetical protein